MILITAGIHKALLLADLALLVAGGCSQPVSDDDRPPFFNERQTVDQIPLDRLVGPGILIDVGDQVQSNRDYLVGIEDLRLSGRSRGGHQIDALRGQLAVDVHIRTVDKVQAEVTMN